MIGLEVLFNRVLNFGPEELERQTELVSAPLREILRKALQADPSNRYSTAAEMRDDLRYYLRTSEPSGFGRLELEEERKAILNEATERKLLAAQSIERGVLPTPEDLFDNGQTF